VVREAFKSLAYLACKAWQEDKPNKEVCPSIFENCHFHITKLDDALCGKNPAMCLDDERISNERSSHIVKNAFAGGIIGVSFSAIAQYKATGSVKWKVVGVSALLGVAIGTLATIIT